ncbi:hypothetical protein [Microbacterium sp.]|uniref:hypothetical protein n=1 Tax=Microbacterium sp. TaxID=51671 RepID=UPI0039E2FCDC
MSPLRHEIDVRPAQAVAALLDATGERVTSVIPPGYEAYIRVLNPIQFRDGSVVSWTDAVLRSGVEPRAWMQWPELVAVDDVVLPDGGVEPDMGGPPVARATHLIEALRPDSGVHYFASWAGYATEISEPYVAFSPYQHEMVLYSGRLIDDGGAPLVPTTATGRVPMYWWPSDHRWLVGQDIHARSLIVGCTQTVARTILESEHLDAYPISSSDNVRGEEF